MAVKIRLARRGVRKKPYYHIVVADARAPRDGSFLATVGKYNPMLKVSSLDEKTTVNEEQVKHWLSRGAIPTHKVHDILAYKGLLEKRVLYATPKKSAPKAKAAAKIQEAEETQAKLATEETKKVATVTSETQITETTEATVETTEAPPKTTAETN